VGATASLSPSSLPPGGTVSSFTLTIQTPLATLETRPLAPRYSKLPGSGLLAVLLLPANRYRRRFSRKGCGRSRSIWPIVLIAASGALSATLATGCADRINTVSEDVSAKSYTLTVTGTATSPTGAALQHSVSVTLEVI
jgi:RsiW-degrading membrane proteinase PrsW (M82 family)